MDGKPYKRGSDTSRGWSIWGGEGGTPAVIFISGLHSGFGKDRKEKQTLKNRCWTIISSSGRKIDISMNKFRGKSGGEERLTMRLRHQAQKQDAGSFQRVTQIL